MIPIHMTIIFITEAPHLVTYIQRLLQQKYCIMQIVCGGKVSWLHDLLVIYGKTFAIV